VRIDRVRIFDFAMVGAQYIHFTNVQTSEISNCMFQGTKGSCVSLVSDSNNVILRGNYFSPAHATAVGVVIGNNIINTLVLANNFEGNAIGDTAILCSGSHATTIRDNFIEFWSA